MKINQLEVLASVKCVAREILVVSVAASVLALGYQGIRHVLSRKAAERARQLQESIAHLPVAAVGTSLAIRGATFQRSALSIVLVTSPDCPHCIASASFHRSVSQVARQHGIPMYVAVPDPAAAKSYLKSAGLDRCEVRSWQELGFRVYGTPTLVTGDKQGIAKRVWLGRVPGPKEEEVLDAIRDPSKSVAADMSPGREGGISLVELDALRRKGRVALLDIRERNEFRQWHISGAANIPLPELPARAPFELDRSKIQVIDCSNLSNERCDAAVSGVRAEGFDVRFAGGGSISQNCAVTGIVR